MAVHTPEKSFSRANMWDAGGKIVTLEAGLWQTAE